MKKKNIFKITIISLFIVSLCICTFLYIMQFIIFGDPTGLMYQIFNNRDSFYTGAGELDSDRFPLIKPYEVVRLRPNNAEIGWQIIFQLSWEKRDIMAGAISQVERIAYENGIFMIYTPFVSKLNQGKDFINYHWFVIIPAKEVETGFETEEQFFNYLNDYDIRNPDWKNPDTIYRQYGLTGCLDWIPGCTSK